ncbi:MAG: cupredoxin family copper-binding protein, partial [Acidimicrobiia bacterium]|nr:cupredoxin family copper-binding protein [Acidimicrobiia bacterium]
MASAFLLVPYGAARAANASISIVDYSFQPSSVTVSVGESVVWTNQGSATHTVSANDGSFDSGSRTPGQTFTHMFSQVGSYSYHCNIHPYMTGTVTVQGSGPPTTQPPAPAPTSPPQPAAGAAPAAAAAPAATAAPRTTVAPPPTAAPTTTSSPTTTL